MLPASRLPGQFGAATCTSSLSIGLALWLGPLPGVGQVTLRAATLADEQMSDAEAASVCPVPLPYALPPTRYTASDVPWSIQEQPHEVQTFWHLLYAPTLAHVDTLVMRLQGKRHNCLPPVLG